MEANPDHPRSFLLQSQWTEKGKPGYSPTFASGGGGGGSYQAGSSKQTIGESQDEDLRLGSPPLPGQPLSNDGPRVVHRHTIAATIVGVNLERPPFYPACPESVEAAPRDQTQTQAATTRRCHKKVQQDEQTGVWRCQANHMCQVPTYRYICRLQVSDQTGTIDCNCFDEIGVRLFGCQANEMAELWEGNNDEARAKMNAVMFRRVVVKLRAQKEVFNDEERTKYVIQEVQDIPLVAEGKQLMSAIKQTVGAF
jgi:replication factor A1